MRKMSYFCSFVTLVLGFNVTSISAADGKKVVDTFCAGCHIAGVLGAPKLGNSGDWDTRVKKGMNILYDHSMNGFNNMPARGGNPKLSDADLKAAVDHMVSLLGSSTAPVAKSGAPVQEATAPAVKIPAKKAAKVKTPKKKSQVVKRNVTKANKFNRLLKPASERNPPPAEDGIHDPDNESTHILLPPRESFAALPKANSGNRVDWVKALNDGAISPRYDRYDENAKPVVMDLNIVREVKGSMPDVVYPHKQHTEWLDCSNCHPEIFIPQKGANSISMAAILLGQKCGVCHGKVAFPVSECRKCHSKRKPKAKKK